MSRSVVAAIVCGLTALSRPAAEAHPTVPIEVGFLWHMHQPIYVPYLTPPEVDATGLFTFSVQDTHHMRVGPYRGWPGAAIGAGLSQPNLGAQVSFSGSLVENLDAMEAVAPWNWSNWTSDYNNARAWSTALGNPRLDLVAFGYHHPLMPLLDERDMRMQLRLHKLVSGQTWVGPASRGIFPPETAFSTRIIPALAAEGIEWALVDNIHFDRACIGYPHNDAAGIPAPNRADQINPNPGANGGAWVALQNLWAPTPVSVPFGYQPAWVEHVDPNADPLNIQPADVSRIVGVPAARYEGNEDGRGGFGAFLYQQVMDQYRAHNTDAARPMFVMLHHDGDNFGGGTESYYHSNFQQMVAWVSGTADYNVSTVDDYLERFPVPQNAVIHVENGSWAGADAGDPEFKKWMGDPDENGWSPDRNSWAVLTAAKNIVFTAEDAAGPASTNLSHVLAGVGSPVERAWHFLLAAQASDHWYWDGTEVWDSNVTVGANQAVEAAGEFFAAALFNDATEPTVLVPHREPYNPGGDEFGQSMPTDFEVWTFAHDYSGLDTVTLRWRADADGINPLGSYQNETYAGGPEVGAWESIAMTPTPAPARPPHVEAPHVIATRYAATIAGHRNVLLDYYVEAADTLGNVHRSDIQHVWVGDGAAGGGNDPRVTIDPTPPQAGQPVTVAYQADGGPLASASTVRAHVGFDSWQVVLDPDQAMADPDADGVWEVTVNVPAGAMHLDLAFNDGGTTWDTNAGQDWSFAVAGASPPAFTLDGALDAGTVLLASEGVSLWGGLDGSTLYVATEAPGDELDRFIFVAGAPGAEVAAPWAKAGQVARWDALLAGESTNDFAGWFDQSAPIDVARGAVLEGTIDLALELGDLPDAVFVAVGSWGTNEAGQLDPAHQAPASINNDGILDAAEYLRIELCELVDGCCPGDLWGPAGVGDDMVDIYDAERVIELIGFASVEADNAPPIGSVDAFDGAVLMNLIAGPCP
ncbi:MAG: carbohydrate binding domain-containing protein [Planctomycetota bacterium]